MTRTRRDLAAFTVENYDKGRNVLWQAAWHAASYMLFQAFWFPRLLRPHLLRLFGAKVGYGVLIREGVKIHWPWKLIIGDYVWIGANVRILNLEDIKIGNSVCVSQEAFLSTGSHDTKSLSFALKNRPIEVEDEVWICARAMILAGSKVPRGEVVPANSVFKQGREV